ncbi:MAG: restriction endonuclease subunit S [Ruminococcus sp.]|nr:restriction endonuclease subunit S [Ruminococcus sp.]
MGSNQIDIGILSDDVTYSVSPAYHTYEIKGIDYDYLRYCLECRNADMFVRYVKRGSRQGKTIDLKRWLEYEIPVYSASEQLTIVENLDKVTHTIDLCNQIIEKLDLLVKARFTELFGDPVSNPMKWNIFQIGERCEIITGNTPPRADTYNYGNFIEWIKSDNINTPDTFLTQAEEYLSEKGTKIGRCVDSGSVLMTCIAGSLSCIGNVGVADRRVAFNQQINAIVPKIDETMYIYWLMILSKSYIQNTINMTLKGILSKGKLSIMKFPFPPFELQRQFSDLVEQTEKSKSVVKKVLEKAETLKKALMQEYFG